jgi:hypothetical protein
MSALRAGELVVPERGERRPVDNQAGAGARVLLAAYRQEPLQERGYFPAAAQELIEDGKQLGEVGHHVAGQPGLPGRAGDSLDHECGVAVADVGQGVGEADGSASGPGARRCELGWLRFLRDQCAASQTPFFLKQLGSVAGRELGAGPKGGDWDRWPEDLKVREFPLGDRVIT